MPYKEKAVVRLYYTIGEVAEMFDVNPSLIRFWEKEFDILQPKKNKKGNRMFTPEDIENIKLVYHLVKERGFTLEGAKRKITFSKEDAQNSYELVQSLKRVRDFLTELKEEL